MCCADFADKLPHPVCRLEIGLRVGHGQHEANIGVNRVMSGKNFIEQLAGYVLGRKRLLAWFTPCYAVTRYCIPLGGIRRLRAAENLLNGFKKTV